jgi:hypothetical protein
MSPVAIVLAIFIMLVWNLQIILASGRKGPVADEFSILSSPADQ